MIRFKLIVQLNYHLLVSSLDSGLEPHSDAGFQAKRIPRRDQVSDTWKDVHVQDPGADEDRVRAGGGVEAEDADPRSSQTAHAGGADRGVQEQHNDTDTVQEKLLQRAERSRHVLHDHRRRGRQQERIWLGDAQLEGCSGLQYLATVSGKRFSEILFYPQTDSIFPVNSS